MVTTESIQSKPAVWQGSPKSFEPQYFWSVWNYGIKNYCTEVPLNGITSVKKFMKMDQAFQKLLVGWHTDRLVIL
jgi:hypothetical protein